jgi:hypothetical protein
VNTDFGSDIWGDRILDIKIICSNFAQIWANNLFMPNQMQRLQERISSVILPVSFGVKL